MITEKTQFLVDDLADLRAKGLFRPLRVLDSAQGPEAVVDGKRVINLSSNNYLGLNTHPRLKEATIRATEQWGAGSGAVRTIDGIRLSRAERSIFKHRDMDDLERHLAKHADKRVKLVVTDGVFSMDGDIAPLAQIVERAEAHRALVMVDDAHASGVLGANGRAGGPPDGHPLQGDRRAGRIRGLRPGGARLPEPPGQAVPVQHLPSARGGRRLYRRQRRPAGRAGTDRAAVGQHPAVQ